MIALNLGCDARKNDNNESVHDFSGCIVSLAMCALNHPSLSVFLLGASLASQHHDPAAGGWGRAAEGKEEEAAAWGEMMLVGKSTSD